MVCRTLNFGLLAHLFSGSRLNAHLYVPPRLKTGMLRVRAASLSKYISSGVFENVPISKESRSLQSAIDAVEGFCL